MKPIFIEVTTRHGKELINVNNIDRIRDLPSMKQLKEKTAVFFGTRNRVDVMEYKHDIQYKIKQALFDDHELDEDKFNYTLFDIRKQLLFLNNTIQAVRPNNRHHHAETQCYEIVEYIDKTIIQSMKQEEK